MKRAQSGAEQDESTNAAPEIVFPTKTASVVEKVDDLVREDKIMKKAIPAASKP